MHEKLKLAALDLSDLEVISAHLQDAVLLIGDMKYDPKAGSVIFLMNRFDWSGAAASEASQPFRRRHSALQFDRVQRVRSRKVRMDAKMAVLSLLSIAFSQSDAPSGQVKLIFSGGGEIELDVECIEARLVDTGPEWETANRPDHDDEDLADGAITADANMAAED